jgi:putative addiction module killer protein
MYEIRQTDAFRDWYARLADVRGRARIRARLERLSHGHFGDARFVGDGVSELRVDFGPGYRVYYIRGGSALVILLCGGDKGSQDRDIRRARAMAAEWE